MRAFVPDMTEFFSWMDKAGFKYVVLRGFLDFDKGYPPKGARKRDIDMLVEDAAQIPIRERYGKNKRKDGVECDFYNVSGRDGGDFIGFPYYPKELAEQMLARRRLWNGLFYIAAPREHFLSLAYHVAYQKAETSGLDLADAGKSAGSKYIRELTWLKEQLDLNIPLTLRSLHAHLKQEKTSISYEPLRNIIVRSFMAHYKSMFLAEVCAEFPGEMNLFVIRTVAARKKMQHRLLEKLNEQYKIMQVKDIPWHVRLLTGHKMRGGKWRRGGYPCIAVVVYDPHPYPPSNEEDKNIQAFVFNARQFEKRGWREWFTKTTGAKPSANPIHSTDNEAEAIGHLPLFFTQQEQDDIFRQLQELRKST